MQQFSFSTFKQVMEISDIEESAYGFILRSIFAYLKKTFSIDLSKTESFTIGTGSTTSNIVLPYTTSLEVDQVIRIGNEEVFITGGTSDILLTTTTISVSPNLSVAPVSGGIALVFLQVAPIDLQYAIFQHAKFIYESQKKLTSVIDSVTDATGNKATYKVKPPSSILMAYAEYSPDPLAFS